MKKIAATLLALAFLGTAACANVPTESGYPSLPNGWNQKDVDLMLDEGLRAGGTPDESACMAWAVTSRWDKATFMTLKRDVIFNAWNTDGC